MLLWCYNPHVLISADPQLTGRRSYTSLKLLTFYLSNLFSSVWWTHHRNIIFGPFQSVCPVCSVCSKIIVNFQSSSTYPSFSWVPTKFSYAGAMEPIKIYTFSSFLKILIRPLDIMLVMYKENYGVEIMVNISYQSECLFADLETKSKEILDILMQGPSRAVKMLPFH